MRLCLIFKAATESLLPFNYNFSIYHAIDHALMKFNLRTQNPGTDHHFCFSNFFGFSYQQSPKGLLITSEEVRLIVSIVSKNDLPFEEIFKVDEFQVAIFDSVLVLKSISVEAPLIFEANKPLVVQAISPIVIEKIRPDTSVEFVDPNHAMYAELLKDALIQNWQNTHQRKLPLEIKSAIPDDFFTLLGKARSKLIQVRNEKIRGFEYSCVLKLPPTLLEIAYLGGLGIKNHLGFGILQLVEQPVQKN